MTRESLAKDILIALIPEWRNPKLEVPEDVCCTCTIAYTSVALADALLEALATKEATASWLSKEVQKTGTSAGCLSVLRGIAPGASVIVRAKGDPKLAEWDGFSGVVQYMAVGGAKVNGRWSISLDSGDLLLVPPEYLEVRG